MRAFQIFLLFLDVMFVFGLDLFRLKLVFHLEVGGSGFGLRGFKGNNGAVDYAQAES